MILSLVKRGRLSNLGELPPGDDGVAATIAAIQAVIDDAAFGPDAKRLRALAAAIAAGSGASSPQAFGVALWQWCRRYVVFERDPEGIELVRHPGDLLDSIEAEGVALGDCDDLATLAASIIAAASMRPVLVTVGRKNPGRFEHIFFAIRLGGGELSRRTVFPLDPQERNPPGRWPTNTPRVQLWSVTPTPNR